MAKIERRSISQKTVISSSQGKKPPKWQPLVSELEELAPDGLLVLSPEEGESLRALKVQVSRAAKAANRSDDISYGENPQGQVEVWLRDKPKQRRGPRKTATKSASSQ
jgi:hypothetical protein